MGNTFITRNFDRWTARYYNSSGSEMYAPSGSTISWSNATTNLLNNCQAEGIATSQSALSYTSYTFTEASNISCTVTKSLSTEGDSTFIVLTVTATATGNTSLKGIGVFTSGNNYYKSLIIVDEFDEAITLANTESITRQYIIRIH